MASTRNKGTVTLLGIVATGTWGDVFPYVCLALGLQRSGFAIKFVTHSVHAHTITHTYGLTCVGIKGDPQSVYNSTAFRDGVASGSMLKLASLFQTDAAAYMEANMGLIHAGVKDVDGIVCAHAVLTECAAIAQKYQIGLIVAPLLPFSPSGEIPVATVLPEPFKYTFLNKLTYDLSGLLLWTMMGHVYNAFRTKTLGIGPQMGYVIDGIPQVTGFSSIVVPRPSDWGSNVYTSGYWKLPPDLDAPPAGHPILAALLARPSPDNHLRPIFVTFEFVPLADPVTFIRTVYTLAAKWGVPVVLAAGATDVSAARTSPRLEGLDGLVFEVQGDGSVPVREGAEAEFAAARTRLLIVQTVSYSWALPRCSVAVHHGGAAVAQAALEAGIPSVAFPAFGDQYFWAARISALGAGPILYFPMRQVLEKLDECVTVARQERIRARAAEIGDALRSQGDGVQLACAAIRSTFSRAQNRHCGIICQWAPDDSRDTCTMCNVPFTLTNRRRHCRSCGALACYTCLALRCHLPGYPENAPQITCERCIDTRRAFFAMHVGRSVVPSPPEAGAVADQAFVTVAAASPRGPSGAAAPASASSRAYATPVLTPMHGAEPVPRDSVLRSDVDGFMSVSAADAASTGTGRSLQAEFAAADVMVSSPHAGAQNGSYKMGSLTATDATIAASVV